MKKTLLYLSLIFLPFQAHTAPENISSEADALCAEIKAVPFGFFEKSFKCKAAIISQVLFSCGALTLPTWIFSEKKDRMICGVFIMIFSLPATFFLANAYDLSQNPLKIVINRCDRTLLGLVLTHAHNPELLVQNYKAHFNDSRFPVAESFYELNKIKAYLVFIKNKCETLKKRPACLPRLTQLISSIDNTLSLLENDPQWLQEHGYSFGQSYRKQDA